MADSWLLSSGEGGFNADCDLNYDGTVDNDDSDILAANWHGDSDRSRQYYYLFDGLGSVIALTDTAGNTVETYRYDVYGKPQILDNTRTVITVSAVANNYMFTARRYDPETKLYHYRARMYNPTIGRFLQTDPIGYADGLNMYAYVGNLSQPITNRQLLHGMP